MLRRFFAPAKWRVEEVLGEFRRLESEFLEMLPNLRLLAFNPESKAAHLMWRFGRACRYLAGIFAIRQALLPERHATGGKDGYPQCPITAKRVEY
jgi:hypothetical protein